MTLHNIHLGIQIVPIAPKEQIYALVDAAIAVIKDAGVPHQITPFETVMEGKYDQLMEICDRAQKATIAAGATECLLYYRIHVRTTGDVSFEEKKLAR